MEGSDAFECQGLRGGEGSSDVSSTSEVDFYCFSSRNASVKGKTVNQAETSGDRRKDIVRGHCADHTGRSRL